MRARRITPARATNAIKSLWLPFLVVLVGAFAFAPASALASGPTVAAGATNVTTNSATIVGQVNPNGSATTYWCDYGTTANYGSTTAIQNAGSGNGAVDVSCSLNGLQPGTTYHYVLMAEDAGNNVTIGNDNTFTTYTTPVVDASSGATSITSVSATLRGTVNPNGDPTTYVCKWATHAYFLAHSDYNNSSSASLVGAGSSPVAVSCNASGLTENTQYDYAIVADNGDGTPISDHTTFSTLSGPAVTNVSVSSITTSSATINGTVNPEGVATSYYCEWATDAFYTGNGNTYNSQSGSTGVGGGTNGVAASCNVGSLTSGTTYHYAIVATDANSGTTTTTDGQFTVYTVPAAAASGVSNVGATTVTLNGSVNPHNFATTFVCNYATDAYYQAHSAYDHTTASASAGSGNVSVAKTCDISGLTPGTLYHFELLATNSGGFFNESADLIFQTLAPPVATTGASSNVAATTATVAGTVNPSGFNTDYTCKYATDTYYQANGNTYNQSAPGTVPGPLTGNANVGVSCNLTGLQSNTTYHFAVTAFSSQGSSTGADATFTTPIQAPSATSGVASGISSTAATLNGTVNPNGFATTYVCDYATDAYYTGNGSTYNSHTGAASAGSGSSPVAESCNISGLTANTLYHFRITATNAGGTTSSTDVTFTTLAPPVVTTGASSSITALTATVAGTVNPMGSNTNYQCLYATDAYYTGNGSTYNLSASGTVAEPLTGSNVVAVTCNLTNLTPGTLYHYTITASSSQGTATGVDATFTTLAEAPTVTTGAASSIGTTSATLNAVVNPESLSTTYTFDYGTSPSYGSETDLVDAGSGTTNQNVSFTLTGLSPGTTYHVAVVAANSLGVTQGLDVTFTTLSDAAPTVNTDEATAIGITTATLTGQVTPNGKATTYQFEYATDAYYTGHGNTYNSAMPAVAAAVGAGQVAVNETANLTGLVPSTTYDYTVWAHNADGTVTGTNGQFTTNSAAVDVAPGPPSNVTATSATVSGVVNLGGAPGHYQFVYATAAYYNGNGQSFNQHTNSTALAASANDVSESASLTGLLPNTAYVYAIRADNGGAPATAPVGSFTTSAAAPTIVGVNPVLNGTSATLQATVNPNGSATTYRFRWGPSSSYTHTTAWASAGSGQGGVLESTNLSNLKLNTVYHYQVTAIGAGKTVTTDGTFNSRGKPVVTAGTPTPIAATTATIKGTVNPNGISATCVVKWGTSIHLSHTTACVAPVGSGITAVNESIVLNGLTTHTTYHYQIVATNAAGTVATARKTFTTT